MIKNFTNLHCRLNYMGSYKNDKVKFCLGSIKSVKNNKFINIKLLFNKPYLLDVLSRIEKFPVELTIDGVYDSTSLDKNGQEINTLFCNNIINCSFLDPKDLLTIINKKHDKSIDFMNHILNTFEDDFEKVVTI